MRTTYACAYTNTNTWMRACVGARVALIDACADADGLLAAEGGLAPGAHTLVSLSLDRHRSVYYLCVLTGVLTGTTTGAYLEQARSTILETTRIRRTFSLLPPSTPEYHTVVPQSTR
jgi:hypothetical protein